MKVMGCCSLEERIVMKEFNFEQGTSIIIIREAVKNWAMKQFDYWYVIDTEDTED